MTRQESAVNESLCALDEAHRLGHINRDEYRARRRYVIGRLSDSNGETARNAITEQGSVVDARGHHGGGRDKPAADTEAMQAMFPSRAPMVWKVVVALLALAILVGLVLYLLLNGS